jgi:arsenical pump membrane protein
LWARRSAGRSGAWPSAGRCCWSCSTRWSPARTRGASPGDIPWSLLGLVAGLLLLVGGAEQANLFAPLVGAISAAARQGPNGLPGLVVGTAVLANVVNNLPAAVVSASALSTLPSGADRSNLVAAVIVGVNLGPNLTTIGSLATMLWLLLLRRRGLNVSPLEYLRVGAVVTVPALAVAAATLWLTGAILSHGS